MTYTNSKIIALAAIAAIALGSSPALAAGPTMPTALVNLEGIDLASPAGQVQAERRIVSAARKVCGYRSGVVTLSERQLQNACVSQASDSARTRMASMVSSKSVTLVVSTQPVTSVPGTAR